MNNNFQEQLKLLSGADEGTLPKEIAQNSRDFSYAALRELCESGLMKAEKHDAIDNRRFYDIRITSQGRKRLEELQQAVPDQGAQPANAKLPKGRKPGYEWHKNPLLIVSLIIVGGVLVAFVVYLIRNHFGIPL